jgi:glycosyltransferase involved in cell wall biosynthesis
MQPILIRKITNKFKNIAIASKDKFQKPYTVFNIIGDGADWVLDYESKELLKIVRKLGFKQRIAFSYNNNLRQCVHYTSQFVLADPATYNSANRFSVDYYHGLPSAGKTFSDLFQAFRKNKEKVYRVRVSNSLMEELILSSGINSSRVHRIPIGVDTGLFSLPSAEEKSLIRKRFGIPQNALVIGSFQKDGNGWGEGSEPKLIKGPDIFLKTLDILKKKTDIYVLLTGPARGYVKRGLEKLGIPYTHNFLKSYFEISEYYKVLDLYLVTSREEGGPRAVLESMASGVPLVTTKVGQATDLVKHGENGWMVEIDDVEGLVYWSTHVLDHLKNIGKVLKQARLTAEKNTYSSQLPLWNGFFAGYLER